MISLYFKPLKDVVKKPVKAHETDAGFDLYSIEEIVLYPNKQTKLSTGIAVQAKFDDPEDAKKYLIELKIEGTSGNAAKLGIFPIGGVIDQEYTGEIGVVLCNLGGDTLKIEAGKKIAQLVPHVIPKISRVVYLGEKDEFETTSRGQNGFGSTGTAAS